MRRPQEAVSHRSVQQTPVPLRGQRAPLPLASALGEQTMGLSWSWPRATRRRSSGGYARVRPGPAQRRSPFCEQFLVDLFQPLLAPGSEVTRRLLARRSKASEPSYCCWAPVPRVAPLLALSGAVALREGEPVPEPGQMAPR